MMGSQGSSESCRPVGAKSVDCPVARPTRSQCVLNLKTAHVLGLTIPPHVLLQTTEVIQ